MWASLPPEEQRLHALWLAAQGRAVLTMSEIRGWSVGEILMAEDAIEVQRLVDEANRPEPRGK
uniref:Uncharacterized protein n=1 Tax=viral metagenome TaxID=1070528 RepID=A0A6M3KRB4_9ZZZZ